MKKLVIVMLFGLILGYGFGAVLSPLGGKDKGGDAPEKSTPDFPDAVEVEVPVAAVDAEQLAALERERDGAMQEVAELKAALDEARAEIAGYAAEKDKAKSGRSDEERRQDWAERRKEREEQFKKENPEAYAEMQKRRTEFMDKLDGAVAEKSAFLVNLDTSEMSEEEKTNHDELLGRVAEAWELMNGMKEGKMPSRDDWGKIGENMRSIRELYGKEREYVLKQVGKDMGYDDKKAEEFSKYIQEVFQKTSPDLPMNIFGLRGGRHSSRRSSQNQGNEAQKPDVAK